MEWVKKGGNGIGDVDIGLGGIVEGMGTNNQVAPDHGAPIGYYIIVLDGRKITYEIYIFAQEVGHNFPILHFLSPILHFPRPILHFPLLHFSCPLLQFTEFLFGGVHWPR